MYQEFLFSKIANTTVNTRRNGNTLRRTDQNRLGEVIDSRIKFSAIYLIEKRFSYIYTVSNIAGYCIPIRTVLKTFGKLSVIKL